MMRRVRQGLFVFVATIGFQAAASYAATAPSALYLFDELSGTIATDSVGSNDGSLITPANVTQGAGGVFGTAYNFVSDSASGGVNLGNSSIIQPNDDFTITMWINPSSLDSFDRIIESMGGSASTDQGLRLDLGGAPGDSARVLIRDGTGASATIQHSLNMSTNQWYFVAVRFDKDAASDQLQLSVLDQVDAPTAANINNGTSGTNIAASIQTNGILYEAGLDTTVASKSAGGTIETSNGYNGHIDDLAFYSSVLTNDQLNFVRRFGAQTVMPTIGWDAEDTSSTTASSWASNIDDGTPRTWNLSGDADTPALVDVSGPSEFRIDQAYQFVGNTGFATSSSPLPNRGDDVSIELYIKPTDLTGQEVVFEAGGDANGFSILLDGDQLKLRYDNDSVSDLAGANFLQVAHTLTAADITDFIQVVAEIDLGNDLIELFVNGDSVGAIATANAGTAAGNIGSWGGGNNDALGSGTAYSASDIGGDDGADLDSFRAFDGLIGVVRFYSGTLLSDDQVLGNYQAMLVPEPASMSLLLIGAMGLLRRRR